MNVPRHILEAHRWLRYAEEDLTVAEMYPRLPGIAPRHACFHAQQAAEKAIKAVLVFTRIEFPPRHDLDVLRDLVPAGWQFKTDHPDLGELTEWVVEGRYPGLRPDPTSDDAIEAIAQAHAVLASVTRDLRQHGLTE